MNENRTRETLFCEPCRRTRSGWVVSCALTTTTLAGLSFAAGPDAGGQGIGDASVPSSIRALAAPTASSTADTNAASVHGCVQSLAKGAARPVVSEELPRRGTSGWIATLTLTIRHGRGEHVLPSGLELQRGAEAEKELRTAGFAFPEQDGGTGAAKVTVLPEDKDHPEIVTTVLEIPLVLLPEKPGRNMLVLPPLPVAIARANGDLSTVCTRPHGITVEDPIAETPDPEPRANPPPRAQREEWREAKIVAAIVASALVLGVLFGLLFRRWKSRPRPVPPPPPPRPAWETALERLHSVRHAGLLDTQRKGEFCDRVSDALREYVGTSLGFDGLERTTDEITEELRRSTMADAECRRVLDVLRECDLVKFAKYTPETAACMAMLDSAEAHVRTTMPRARTKSPAKRELAKPNLLDDEGTAPPASSKKGTPRPAGTPQEAPKSEASPTTSDRNPDQPPGPIDVAKRSENDSAAILDGNARPEAHEAIDGQKRDRDDEEAS